MIVKRAYYDYDNNGNGDLVYMDELGREHIDIMFYVDGKKVSAEVVEADTTEGKLTYVDPQMPDVSTELASQGKAIALPDFGERLVTVEGKVKVLVAI
jgi:hypothetical protein